MSVALNHNVSTYETVLPQRQTPLIPLGLIVYSYSRSHSNTLRQSKHHSKRQNLLAKEIQKPCWGYHCGTKKAICQVLIVGESAHLATN